MSFVKHDTGVLRKLYEVVLLPTLGLRWKNVGSTVPTNGKELTNNDFASLLQSRTAFTREEWDVFGIKDLRTEHFIKSGTSYFRPDVPTADVDSAQQFAECFGQASHVLTFEDAKAFLMRYRQTREMVLDETAIREFTVEAEGRHRKALRSGTRAVSVP